VVEAKASLHRLASSDPGLLHVQQAVFGVLDLDVAAEPAEKASGKGFVLILCKSPRPRPLSAHARALGSVKKAVLAPLAPGRHETCRRVFSSCRSGCDCPAPLAPCTPSARSKGADLVQRRHWCAASTFAGSGRIMRMLHHSSRAPANIASARPMEATKHANKKRRTGISKRPLPQ
jgi:hypothetical protein